jgi:hypothetical protein
MPKFITQHLDSVKGGRSVEFRKIEIKELPQQQIRGNATPAGNAVVLTKKGNELDVTVEGQPFTDYHFAKTQKKSYFWPMRAAGGQIVTRSLERPPDHPHHKGLWFSVDAVNGIGFWDEKGKIANVSVEPIVTHGNPARFKVVNHWLGKDGQPVLIESTNVSVNANRMIAYDAELTAGKNPVTFADTKEGMFALRVADSMRGIQGGTIENAEGLHGESQCWGKTADWVDYDGYVDGKLVGVAIFDNPQNFRRSRYHVRDYGLFSISPFGEHDYERTESAGSRHSEAGRKPAVAVRDLRPRRRHKGRRRRRDLSPVRGHLRMNPGPGSRSSQAKVVTRRPDPHVLAPAGFFDGAPLWEWQGGLGQPTHLEPSRIRQLIASAR